MNPRPLCRHCSKNLVCRPRGLCWGCFYAPAIREQYPPMASADAGRMGGLRNRDRIRKGGHMTTVPVPVPPSTNNLFLSMGRKRVKTPEYRSWLEVAILSFRQLSKPERFPVEVVIQIHGGKRFNTRRDVGNCEKAISDALVEAGVIPDDSISAGLWRIVVEYKPAAKTAEPCAIVSVNPLEM